MPLEYTAFGWPYHPTDDNTADIGSLTEAQAQKAEDREPHQYSTAERDALTGVGLRPGRLLVHQPASGEPRLQRWDGLVWRDLPPVDPIATVAGARTIGTGATQAAAGSHVHDSRYSRLRLVGRTSQVAAGGSPPTVDSGLLTMQAGVWRGSTTVSGGIAVVFPAPFPAGLLTVVVCNGAGEVSDPVNRSAVSVTQRSSTGFTADFVPNDAGGNPPEGSTAQVNWVAVGW